MTTAAAATKLIPMFRLCLVYKGNNLLYELAAVQLSLLTHTHTFTLCG